jgi:uncharacterized membrane protein
MTERTTGTTVTRAGRDPSTPGRGLNVTLWVLQVLAAAVFVFAAMPKLTADPQAVAGFEALGLGIVGLYLVGVAEVAGAIGLLVPRLTGLAAACLTALMVGAAVSTVVLMGFGVAVLIPVVTGLVTAVIAWFRRDSIAALRGLVRR